MSLFGKHEDGETSEHGDRKDRQHQRSAGPSCRDARRHDATPGRRGAVPRRCRAAPRCGFQGARGRGVALCADRVRLRARLVHNHVQARQGGQATVPPRARPELQYREHAGRQAAARAVGRARPEGWRRRAARGAQAHPRARGGERPPGKAAAFFAEDQARPRAAA